MIRCINCNFELRLDATLQGAEAYNNSSLNAPSTSIDLSDHESISDAIAGKLGGGKMSPELSGNLFDVIMKSDRPLDKPLCAECTTNLIDCLDQQLDSLENQVAEYSNSSYGTCLPDETFEWAFDLCRRNMRAFYVQSEWGWDDKEKRSELQATTSRYLLVTSVETSKPVAYCHFRFDGDDGRPVLYCYELQVEPEHQRKGLGAWLVSILAQLGTTCQMQYLMATVFKHNPASLDFFRKQQFKTDETNDPQTDYLILSREI